VATPAPLPRPVPGRCAAAAAAAAPLAAGPAGAVLDVGAPRPVPTCPSSRPRRVRCHPRLPACGALSSPACTPWRRHTPAPAPCRSPALLRPPPRLHAPPRPPVRAPSRPPPPARLLRPRAPPTGAPPAPPHPLPLPPPTRTTWPQAYQARRGTTGGVERPCRWRPAHQCSGTRRWGCTALLSRGLPPRCPGLTAAAPPSCAGTAPAPGWRRCRLPASPAPVCRGRRCGRRSACGWGSPRSPRTRGGGGGAPRGCGSRHEDRQGSLPFICRAPEGGGGGVVAGAG